MVTPDDDKIVAAVAAHIEKFADDKGIIATVSDSGKSYSKVTPELVKEVLGETGTVDDVKGALDLLVGDDGKAIAGEVNAAKEIIATSSLSS